MSRLHKCGGFQSGPTPFHVLCSFKRAELSAVRAAPGSRLDAVLSFAFGAVVGCFIIYTSLYGYAAKLSALYPARGSRSQSPLQSFAHQMITQPPPLPL